MQDLRIIENELVPVYETDTGEKVVDGRELHAVVGSKQDFSDWVKKRVLDCDAIEEKDFSIILGRSESGRNIKDYIIKLDTAKEMAMLERNDKGKQARRYFIEVEKKFKQGVQPPLTQPINNELSFEERLKLMEVISTTPEYAIETVSALATPFIKESPKPEPYPRVPVKAPEPIVIESTKKVSHGGYHIPFNHPRLKRYLKKMGLNGTEFARSIGVDISSMLKYTKGKSRPGTETRNKICKALGKPNNWLDM